MFLSVQVNDTVMLDLETGKIKDFIKFDIGQLCMATGGHNRGRVGTIVHKEKHKGSHDIVLVRDSAGQEFATRYSLCNMSGLFTILPDSTHMSASRCQLSRNKAI